MSGETAGKSATAFRTIGEVADAIGVAQHVLRFWETRFSQVRPLQRGGNRRYYRPDDVALLRDIYRMLHVEGFTIRGVQQRLDAGIRAAVPPNPPSLQAIRDALAAALSEARAA